MKKYNDLISVIVPVYKVEKYLDDCIESIVNQTYKSIEIILVDDGSPDNCFQMCEEWKKKDSRIRVIHRENGGLSTARNCGLDISKGEYVMFVDSDDKIHPNMIEILYYHIKEHNADIAVSNYIKINDLKSSFFELCNYEISVVDKMKAFDNLFSEKEIQYVTAWGKLYNIKLFNNIRFPVGRIYEDCYVSYKIYHESNKVIEVPLKLYYYLQRDSSIMSTYRMTKYDDLYMAYYERLVF